MGKMEKKKRKEKTMCNSWHVCICGHELRLQKDLYQRWAVLNSECWNAISSFYSYCSSLYPNIFTFAAMKKLGNYFIQTSPCLFSLISILLTEFSNHKCKIWRKNRMYITEIEYFGGWGQSQAVFKPISQEVWVHVKGISVRLWTLGTTSWSVP